jgi:hypothetical protein
LFWWSILHSTRTQNLFTGDGFGIIREVEIEHDPVIKDVDRVDKGINDLSLVFRTAYVTLAEFLKPEPNPFTGQDWLFQFFFQNTGIQGFFPGFQLVQPLLCGRGQDTLFNGFQKVCQPLLHIPELLFQNGQAGVLLLLGFHNQIYQPFDDFIAENHLNSGFHHEPFQRNDSTTTADVIILETSYLEAAKPELEKYDVLTKQIKAAIKTRKELQAEKKATPILNVLKHRELTSRIEDLTEQLEDLRSERAIILMYLDCEESRDTAEVKKMCTAAETMLEKLEVSEAKYSYALDDAKNAFADLQEQAKDLDAGELYEARLAIRNEKE